jgi:hypothetical protein
VTPLRRASNLGIVLLLGTALTLPAHASPKPKRIAEVDITVVHQHPMCVKLAITGVGQKKMFELKSPVEIYTKALRAVILRSRVFAGICTKDQSGLELSVVVFNGTYVPGAWHVQGTVPVQWRLADPVTRRVLYQEKPNSTGVGDHGIGGAARINAGWEAAMRASIVQGLQDISRLDLSAGK